MQSEVEDTQPNIPSTLERIDFAANAAAFKAVEAFKEVVKEAVKDIFNEHNSELENRVQRIADGIDARLNAQQARQERDERRTQGLWLLVGDVWRLVKKRGDELMKG